MNKRLYSLAYMIAIFVNKTFNGKQPPSYSELSGEKDYRAITEEFKAFADANNRRRQNDNRTT